eukprot:gene23211-66656_t
MRSGLMAPVTLQQVMLHMDLEEGPFTVTVTPPPDGDRPGWETRRFRLSGTSREWRKRDAEEIRAD